MNKPEMDRICIRDLLVRCIIGIYPEERKDKQDVVINLTLYADLSQAAKTDRIEDAVDYKTMKKKILAMVEESSFFSGGAPGGAGGADRFGGPESSAG